MASTTAWAECERDLAGEQVADDDAGGPAVDHDDVEQLGAVVERARAGVDLLGQGLVGAEQELLAGLAPGVERAAHLRAAERAVVEQAAVLAGEGHALRRALVDDVVRHLGEAVHVRLAAAVVAALHGVVEEAVDAVAVAVVVLRRVDAALRGDGVGPTGRVVEGEDLHVVPEPAERGRGRRAGQAGADDDDVELPLVVRVDELDRELVVVPLLLDRAVGDLGVERDRRPSAHAHHAGQHGDRERDVADDDDRGEGRPRSRGASG